MPAARWTTDAIDDLSAIADYSEEHFGSTSTSQTVTKIVASAEALGRAPNRGRSGRRPGTREWVVTATPFIIVYRTTKGAVEILRILHGAQRWP